MLLMLHLLLLRATIAVAMSVNSLDFSTIQFDYIVVGGGTTGLSVAARLSDDPAIMVGIIEAGELKEDDKILISGMFGSTLGDPEYDWMISTNPQAELNNRTIGLGRGKVLGGTSALNFLGYQRASSEEYNGWETLGNPGWNFNNMFEFMKVAEKWTPPDRRSQIEFLANNDAVNHGTQGALLTTPYANYSNIVPTFFSALENLGVKPNKASHGGQTVGTWSITATMDPKNRTRSYSANAYYEPVSSRRNLVLVTGATALKVEFYQSDQRSGLRQAMGVTYTGSDNSTYVVHSRQEIIISCGSVKTPQLLELSGIGNATLLKRMGIPALIDLPGVGENLQDHLGITANFETLSNITTWDELVNPTIAAQQFNQYLQNRTGLYSAVPSTVAFLPLSYFMDENAVVTMKQQLDGALRDPQYQTSTFALQRSWLDNGAIPQVELILFPQGTNTGAGQSSQNKFYTISALIEHPWYRGNVHVASSDGLEDPIVDMRYLESPSDVDVKILLSALKYALKISQTEPMLSMTTAVLGPSLSASDDELITWIRAGLSTNFHLIGTAAMLPREHGGVVDPNLMVYGTSNLRVVDASIYPTHLATHPIGTLYGLGERAARMILK